MLSTLACTILQLRDAYICFWTQGPQNRLEIACDFLFLLFVLIYFSNNLSTIGKIHTANVSTQLSRFCTYRPKKEINILQHTFCEHKKTSLPRYLITSLTCCIWCTDSIWVFLAEFLSQIIFFMPLCRLLKQAPYVVRDFLGVARHLIASGANVNAKDQVRITCMFCVYVHFNWFYWHLFWSSQWWRAFYIDLHSSLERQDFLHNDWQGCAAEVAEMHFDHLVSWHGIHTKIIFVRAVPISPPSDVLINYWICSTRNQKGKLPS